MAVHVDLTHKTVLVTGASRGIGRAIARQCAASGAVVAAQYFRSPDKAESLAAEFPDRVFVLQADLADVDACRRLFTTAASGSAASTS